MPGDEPNPGGVGAALRRVRIVAMHTLSEALRLRLAHLLVAAGTGLVLLALGLREFNFGAAELKFIADFGLGAIGLSGTVLAALATAQLYFDDLASGVAASVLARAVRRSEYLCGRLAGIAALLAIFVAALAIVLGVIIAVREAQLGATLAPLAVFLQACAFVWLKVTLVAAMTLLVSSYAGSSLFASCAGLMLAVIAHLRPFTNTSGWMGFLRLWPNLALFDVGALLDAGHGLSPAALLGLLGYWAVFMSLLLGLASYVFKHREI
jgi:ABC-type transport system involved in multi-copper enzyme maturation permease subunit